MGALSSTNVFGYYNDRVVPPGQIDPLLPLDPAVFIKLEDGVEIIVEVVAEPSHYEKRAAVVLNRSAEEYVMRQPGPCEGNL